MHDLLACVGDGIVSLVGWDLNACTIFTREYIVGPIALLIDVLCAHQGPHTAVFVVLGQLLPIVSRVVVQVQKVVGGATLVFLACIVVGLFSFQLLSLLYFSLLHGFKSFDFSLVPFLTQIGPPVLHMFILLLTHFLVRHCEVLVKSLLLCTVSIKNQTSAPQT